MKNDTPWIILALLLGVAVIALFFFRSGGREEEEQGISLPAQVETPPPPSTAPVPEPEQYPLPEAEPPAEPEPLPSLEDSDGAFSAALERLLGRETVSRYLVPEELIRRIVATVDNLPREKLSRRLWPLAPVTGKFMTKGTDENLVMDSGNYSRYSTLVQLATAVDTRSLMAVYLRFYPLFQQAYEDLGYPGGHFNTRLVQVIDHLLATPEVTGTVRLTRPSVYYRFADARLEALSVGQKSLLRMGPENRAAVRGKLTELRLALAGRTATAN